MFLTALKHEPMECNLSEVLMKQEGVCLWVGDPDPISLGIDVSCETRGRLQSTRSTSHWASWRPVAHEWLHPLLLDTLQKNHERHELFEIRFLASGMTDSHVGFTMS